MIILLTGASGFIGLHLLHALHRAGHVVIAAGRRDVAGVRTIRADFSEDTDAARWISRLQNIDVAINAVGILRETSQQSFESTHTRAPIALFDACVQAGVQRVIQISALGASTGTTAYFRSKHTADEHLSSLPLDWTIFQPSLVYGPGGTSAQLFTLLASLPVIGLPGDGKQLVQPIHIDDVCASIARSLDLPQTYRRTIALVGREPIAYRELLATLRKQMGMSDAMFMPVPRPLMRTTAAVVQHLPGSLLDPETLSMLEAGNTADAVATTELLGRPPRSVDDFIERENCREIRWSAQLRWLMPLLRISIALVWLWTAAVSFGLYPVEASYELLRHVGVPASFSALLLYGAASLDLLLGIGTLLLRKRGWLWIAQMVLIVGYTILISWRLPEFWLHPYGPILKNLPLLTAIYMLYVLEGSDGVTK